MSDVSTLIDLFKAVLFVSSFLVMFAIIGLLFFIHRVVNGQESCSMSEHLDKIDREQGL